MSLGEGQEEGPSNEGEGASNGSKILYNIAFDRCQNCQALICDHGGKGQGGGGGIFKWCSYPGQPRLVRVAVSAGGWAGPGCWS